MSRTIGDRSLRSLYAQKLRNSVEFLVPEMPCISLNPQISGKLEMHGISNSPMAWTPMVLEHVRNAMLRCVWHIQNI